MSDNTSSPAYVMKATDIVGMRGIAKSHFLNPDARRLNKSLGDVAGLTGFGFHIIAVEPSQFSTEHHVHHHEDECVYVLKGEALARISDETVSIGPVEFIGYRKGGLPHSILNTGTTMLRCIVVGERLPDEVCDYPAQGKRMFRNAGLEWSVVDMTAVENPTAGVKS